MTRLPVALLLAPHLFGAYSYYQVDNFTSLSQSWSVNGTPTIGNNLFTAGTGASLISTIGTQTDNYEVKATLSNTVNGGNYAIYLRATANAQFNTTSTGEFYVVELTSPWDTEEGHRIAGLTVTKRVGGATPEQIWGAWQFVHDLTELRVVCANGLITLYVDGIFRGVIADSSLTSGRPGIGVRGTGSPNGWASVSIGVLDTAAPTAISSSSVQSTAYPNQVCLRWTVPADDANGIGVNNFNLFRIQGGVTTWLDYRRLYAGESALTYSNPVTQMEFVDEAVTPGQSYTYKLIPVDWHWNAGPDTLVNVTVPTAASLDARQVGIHSSSAHWGSGGEQIDMRSGNLNFTLPLVTAQGRGGSSVNLALNYNSQQWRLDNNNVWKIGSDVGYGFGWKLLVGSITPYWTQPSVLHHWVYIDGTGAEHRFDVQQGGAQWLSKTSYATFDDSTMRLWFNDGSFLEFLSLSDSSEPDAGTRYPTLFQDSNGNQIKIAYMRGLSSAWSNASARLWRVEDVRATGYGSYPYSTYRTYSFEYTTNELIPHLTRMFNHIGSGDSYSLAYFDPASLTDPFSTSGSFGQTRNLRELRHSTLNLAHGFTYGPGSEMTSSTNPHGGTLYWAHATHIFVNSRGIREVSTRTGPAGTHQFVRDASDSGRPFHPYTKLMDPDGQTDRYYRFDDTSTNQQHYGYISQIDHTERASSTIRLREAFTWAQDSVTRSYVGTATTTYDPAAASSAAKSVTQIVDNFGRLTTRTEYDFTTSGYTPQSPRVTQYTYLTGSDYESRFIRDRIRTVAVSQNGSSYTLVDNTYDNYSGANSLVNRTGLRQHNTAFYGTGFSFRGNPTATTRLGSATITRRFDITGMASEIKEGTSTVTVEPTANNAVPGLITPNSQGSLSTSLYWNSFLGLTQTTGPNGATATTAFDSYARKSQTTSPHGAPTNYSYTNYPGSPNTVTAVVTTTAPGGTRKRFARTTLDGFGRTTKEESGSGDPAATHEVLSIVDTEYGPCACSPSANSNASAVPAPPTAPSIGPRTPTTSSAVPAGWIFPPRREPLNIYTRQIASR